MMNAFKRFSQSTSAMCKNAGVSLLNRQIVAIILLVLFSAIEAFGVPASGYLGVVMVGFAALSLPVRQSFIWLLAGLMPIAIAKIISPANLSLEMLMVPFILTWSLALLLRRTNEWRHVLEAILLMGILVIGAYSLLGFDLTSWVGSAIAHLVAVMQANGDKQAQQLTPEQISQYARQIAFSIVMFMTVLTIVNLVAARWWQALIVNPGGLRRALYTLKMPASAAVLVIAAIAMMYQGSSAGQDLLALCEGVYFFTGVCLAHVFLSRLPKAGFGFVLFYLALVIVGQVMLPFVAVMALLDSFFDFRKRLGFEIS